MIKNVGGKIKGFAGIVLAVGICVSLVAGFIMIVIGFDEASAMVAWGAAVLIGGPIVSYIGVLFIYGFGELIENTSIIAKAMAKTDESQNTEE